MSYRELMGRWTPSQVAYILDHRDEHFEKVTELFNRRFEAYVGHPISEAEVVYIRGKNTPWDEKEWAPLVTTYTGTRWIDAPDEDEQNPIGCHSKVGATTWPTEIEWNSDGTVVQQEATLQEENTTVDAEDAILQTMTNDTYQNDAVHSASSPTQTATDNVIVKEATHRENGTALDVKGTIIHIENDTIIASTTDRAMDDKVREDAEYDLVNMGTNEQHSMGMKDDESEAGAANCDWAFVDVEEDDEWTVL